MKPESQKIFDILNGWKNYGFTCPRVRMSQLEFLMGVKARGLQSTKDEVGILETARKEIWEEKGVSLITLTGPNGGAELTTDEGKLKHARNQLADHTFTSMRTVDYYDKMFDDIRKKAEAEELSRIQLSLL